MSLHHEAAPSFSHNNPQIQSELQEYGVRIMRREKPPIQRISLIKQQCVLSIRTRKIPFFSCKTELLVLLLQVDSFINADPDI